MANRFPIIVDTDDNNKLKELPSGDNIDLTGSGIVNATNISADTFTLGGSNLNNFSGSWNALTNKPTTIAGFGITDAFDGAYASLTGRPNIPSVLTDLSITDGTSGQVLGTDGGGNFSFIDVEDISTRIENLTDVTINTIQTNQVLRWNGAAFVNSFIDYNTLTNKPNFVAQGDTLTGGLVGDVTGSVFADDSSLLIDAVNGNINGRLRTDAIETNGAGGLTTIQGNFITIETTTDPGTVTLRASGADSTVELIGTTNVTGDLNITGRTDITGSVFADDSALMVDAVNNSLIATNGTFTNIKGSLLTAGGGIIVNGSGSGSIPETVTIDKLDDFITDFKAAVAAAADLADLQTRIAALTYP